MFERANVSKSVSVFHKQHTHNNRHTIVRRQLDNRQHICSPLAVIVSFAYNSLPVNSFCLLYYCERATDSVLCVFAFSYFALDEQFAHNRYNISIDSLYLSPFISLFTSLEKRTRAYLNRKLRTLIHIMLKVPRQQ